MNEGKINLIGYLPPFLQECAEFLEITSAENPQLEEVAAQAGRVRANLFVKTANNDGIKRFESMLNLRPAPELSLEERRQSVMAKWTDSIPYTFEVLGNRLDAVIGNKYYEMSFEPSKYTLKVRLDVDVKHTRENVLKILKNMLPANLIYEVESWFNLYGTFEGKNLGEMGKFTWRQLREEEIYG